MSRKNKAKQQLVASLLKKLEDRLHDSGAGLAIRFARAYYGGVAEEDMVATSPDDLYGSLLSIWNLLQRRESPLPLVRVYNPNYEEHGWQCPHTVLEIVTDDMPFLVDSLRMALARRGLSIHSIVHPVLRVVRDAGGVIRDLPETPMDKERDESVMRFEIDRQTDEQTLRGLRDEALKVLRDVDAVVSDWRPMRQQMRAVILHLEATPPPVLTPELAESLAFLKWLEDHHFTFIGYRDYNLIEKNGQPELRRVPGSGLGILRDEGFDLLSKSFALVPRQLRDRAKAGDLLVVTKSSIRSTVHRASRLDYIGIKRYDTSGRVAGEWRFFGLYSSTVYIGRVSDIPLVRRKVARVVERAALPASSHAGRALLHILETFPRDEIFQFEEDELFETVVGILQLAERHHLKLFLRRDPYARFVSALVYVPRDRYDTETRLRIQTILEQTFGGRSFEFDVQFSESQLARLHLVISTRANRALRFDVAELEDRLKDAILSWDDRFGAALREHFGEEKGNGLLHRYRRAVPAAYREDFTERSTVFDIARLESLADDVTVKTHLYRPLEDPQGLLRFKVFGRKTPLPLSDVLPILERMGLRVLEARPYRFALHPQPLWILEFKISPPAGVVVNVEQIRTAFQETFPRIYAGEVENDGFNRLIVSPGLGWRDVTMLRACCKYLLQTQIPFSQAYMERSLWENPQTAKSLVQLFHARFDPDVQVNRPELDAQITARIESELEAVQSLDQDRILRLFLALVRAMLRTNFFRKQDKDKKSLCLSFKLDPRMLTTLPAPRPRFEVFVYAPWMEGVHLRGGLVARGGVRWSDRPEDFRTEVLGLMKAQMVKNSLIVPVGAKGGFVAKRLPATEDRSLVLAEVVRCYQSFVRGLLDLTDNIVDGKVVAPPGVVRYDGDDPYLVVAADKGTGAFSDIANGIAVEYGFWLGDAFASGGSAGYDHKKMGITARGVWESVKRHFLELGIDPKQKPVTLVGIGDMSGDVFGNGMLYSKRICLVAAFDHRHIFLDPNPDPGVSYAERQRLFAAPRSGWADYDTGLISAGGGVYSRRAKKIDLSPEVRAALGTETPAVTPNELIRLVLLAPVDLLWNGGIGTFVKASDETHDQVGDRANDGIRVNASELRCRIVAEGGNLGLTQRARIEYALAGGSINTDAVDNSAGVDCSDHEVNIKILLDSVVAEGDMTRKQRDRLLAKMTEDVAALVLRHNYKQTQAVSIAAAEGVEAIEGHARLIGHLEARGKLDRHLESLPGEAELNSRASAGKGLTRPELSVLLAYSKIDLFQDLLGSDVASEGFADSHLRAYFPLQLRDRFESFLAGHSLRREIAVTSICNELVDRMGSTFCLRMRDETGELSRDITRCYNAARDVFSVADLWAAIEATDGQVPASIQLGMMIRIRGVVERATAWFLQNQAQPLDMAATVGRYATPVKVLEDQLEAILQNTQRLNLEQAVIRLVQAGVQDVLALRISSLDTLFSALDIAEVATETGREILVVAPTYFGLVETLELHWLGERLLGMPRHSPWDRRACTELSKELYRAVRALTAQVLRAATPDSEAGAAVSAWLRQNEHRVSHCRATFDDVRTAKETSLAMLSVAVKTVRNLSGS